MPGRRTVTLAAMALMFTVSPRVFAQPSKPDGPSATEEAASAAQATSQAPGVPPQEGFTLAIGPSVIVSPRPYGGAHPRVFPVPSIELGYKGWFFRGIRGGYSFMRRGPFSASVYGQVRFSGLEHEASSTLDGMEDRKRSMDAGVELVYRGRPVGFRLNCVADVLGRNKGQEATALVTSGVPLGRRGIVLVGVGPRWLSRNHVDYYYGVRSNEVTPSRPRYSGRATWNLDVTVTAIVNLTPSWHVVAIMNRERFGTGIRDSPIVDRGSSYSLITALNYRF